MTFRAEYGSKRHWDGFGELNMHLNIICLCPYTEFSVTICCNPQIVCSHTKLFRCMSRFLEPSENIQKLSVSILRHLHPYSAFWNCSDTVLIYTEIFRAILSFLQPSGTSQILSLSILRHLELSAAIRNNSDIVCVYTKSFGFLPSFQRLLADPHNIFGNF